MRCDSFAAKGGPTRSLVEPGGRGRHGGAVELFLRGADPLSDDFDASPRAESREERLGPALEEVADFIFAEVPLDLVETRPGREFSVILARVLQLVAEPVSVDQLHAREAVALPLSPAGKGPLREDERQESLAGEGEGCTGSLRAPRVVGKGEDARDEKFLGLAFETGGELERLAGDAEGANFVGIDGARGVDQGCADVAPDRKEVDGAEDGEDGSVAMTAARTAASCFSMYSGTYWLKARTTRLTWSRQRGSRTGGTAPPRGGPGSWARGCSCNR